MATGRAKGVAVAYADSDWDLLRSAFEAMGMVRIATITYSCVACRGVFRGNGITRFTDDSAICNNCAK